MNDAMTTIAQAAGVADRAASDPAFRATLLSSPAATLQTAGVSVPDGSTVQVLENTSSVRHLILPSRPAAVSDADLAAAAAPSGSASSVEEKLAAWGRLVASAWTDAALKARLLQNPNAVLAERGISMAPGVNARVVDALPNVVYVVIPAASRSQP